MKVFTKSLFACALVSLLSTSAQAVTWSGEGGWEVQYTGFVNLFYNQLEFDYANGTTEDSAVLNEGLLPSFHTMKAKSPTVNGLTGTSQITFAVDTSSDKHTNLNKGDAGNPKTSAADTLIDLREVFFNVDGSFGTISVGRTLALFQRQAILKDMTLFGVGALADPDNNGTALGRIGIGYVYPDFRARFAWASPTVNGFQATLGVFQPREVFNGVASTAVPNSEVAELLTGADLANFQNRLAAGARAVNSAITGAAASGVDDEEAVARLADLGVPRADPANPGDPAETDAAYLTRIRGLDEAGRAMLADAIASGRSSAIQTSGTRIETDTPMFQGEVTWSSDMGAGTNLGLWAGFIWQQADVLYTGTVNVGGSGNYTVGSTSTQDVTTSGYNFGLDFTYGNANLVGSYYGGSGLGVLFAQGIAGSIRCALRNVGEGEDTTIQPMCGETDNSGGYIQGTYTIPGAGDSKTKLGLSWGYSEQEAEESIGSPRINNEGYTIGVYHDINSWLKVIAEYNDYDLEILARQVSGFSLGAFMFW